MEEEGKGIEQVWKLRELAPFHPPPLSIFVWLSSREYEFILFNLCQHEHAYVMISELYPSDVHGRDVPDLRGIKNGATFLKDFSGSAFLEGLPEFEEASRELPFQVEWMPFLQSLGAYDFIVLIQDHDSETHSWT